MTINEIKGLTKFLSEEEVEQIKQQIRDKEDILKSGNLDEEEMIQVLNTLFAVLVIEKALESEIEGIEELRDELEQELLECYDTYDSYMDKYRKEDKKRKKRWLLSFFGLSEDIQNKRKNIRDSNAVISKLKNELNELRQQRSNENLREVASKRGPEYEGFCNTPERQRGPKRKPRERRNRMDRENARTTVVVINAPENNQRQIENDKNPANKKPIKDSLINSVVSRMK